MEPWLRVVRKSRALRRGIVEKAFSKGHTPYPPDKAGLFVVPPYRGEAIFFSCSLLAGVLVFFTPLSRGARGVAFIP